MCADLETERKWYKGMCAGLIRMPSEARNKLKWIDLKQRRKVHLGVFFHKAVNGRNSHHSIQMVQQRLATHSHYTRCKRAGHLNSVTHKTAIYEKSVFNRGVKVWNSVPELIKDKETTSFKTTLQRLYQEGTLPLHHHH